MRGKCSSYYNYKLTFQGKTERFKHIQEIMENHPLKRGIIFRIIRKENVRLGKEYTITKIKEPICKLIEIDYSSSDSE